MKSRILWGIAVMVLAASALGLAQTQGRLAPANELVKLTDDQLAAARGLGDADECCDLTSSDQCKGTDGCEAKTSVTSTVAACDSSGYDYAGETTYMCNENGTDPDSVCQNGTLSGCWIKKNCNTGGAVVASHTKDGGSCVEGMFYCRPCGFGSTIATQSAENDTCT